MSQVLLALDTSTDFCSVAVFYFPRAASSPCVISRHDRTGPVSSERALPAICEVLEEAKLTLDDCSAVAFGTGPGSFTGLRTAAGVAQGLAFGLNIPVVPVSTLLACAERARFSDPDIRRVLVAIDARMGGVYWADFAWDNTLEDWRVHHSAALSPPTCVLVPDEPFTLAGNASSVFGDMLPAVTRASVIDTLAMPHAHALSLVGWCSFIAGRTLPAHLAVPEYVRDKVALTTRERA
ncbi:tRNA (adenosine(37)-N6)-threonylcarbamoyltransferase complex dimerization subunit type 1 TsaB [Candidatus Vallotia lariciata]|uniref:tRNA (adenosine(37)-N6)-threonylcarbamoyltransferase complex dimerization subunit type 1 TsaB n=1 Tax=Candidatus Vallotia laricis TaxID=2018052 RepID=UPI001D035C5C|nr:tRNA (adenosine(37)-N6)-threonylcarbamoyltransferase complex dimerization subunit type 1 TsaB [Candidatus Vallotia lariciata]UDG82675.1 tRNA (adenosine(37)-N6)-threonylcarbamoyltransferase complex dimerization subunit type 1 TsaB [Candidatus Vallotia lariciata]